MDSLARAELYILELTIPGDWHRIMASLLIEIVLKLGKENMIGHFQVHVFSLSISDQGCPDVDLLRQSIMLSKASQEAVLLETHRLFLERFPYGLNRKDFQISCDVIHHGG